MTENEISKIVVDCCLKIHKKLGPGLFESVYEEILSFELSPKGLLVERQIPIPVIYEDIKMEVGFRLDLLVQKKVIIELKSIDAVLPVHKKQLITYLKLTDLKLGMLINFNVDLIKDGITRIVNGL
jgi:GxxExxY protein